MAPPHVSEENLTDSRDGQAQVSPWHNASVVTQLRSVERGAAQLLVSKPVPAGNGACVLRDAVGYADMVEYLQQPATSAAFVATYQADDIYMQSLR